MQNKLLVLFLCFSSANLLAQSEFPLAWKAEYGFNAEKRTYNNEATLFFAANDKQASMIDADGKNLWKAVLKDRYSLKEIDEAHWLCKPNVVILYSATKNGSVAVFVDGKNGAELWRTDGVTGFGFDDNDDMRDSYIPELNALLLKKGQTLALADVNTGKMRWTVNAFEGRKLSSLWCANPNGTSLLEVIADNRERSYFDLATGEPVTKISSSFYKRQVSSLYSLLLDKEDMHIRLDYKRRTLRNHTGLKTPMTVTARRFSTGDVLWTTEFEGKLITDLASNKDEIRFFEENGYVFVVYEGISVLNAKTGKLLWRSDFNNSEVDGGLFKTVQNLNISAFPLVDKNSVYVVDLTKETYGIKKLDINTGEVIWKTQKFSGSDIIPAIHLENGLLIAQFGGVINFQQIKHKEGERFGRRVSIEEQTIGYKYRGNAGIKAFDPATGKLVWDEKKLGEKFDFTSGFLFHNNLLYLLTDKSLFALDPASGTVKQKFDLKDARLGTPFTLFFSDDKTKVYTLMEKGISGIDLATGKVLYATKVKDVTGWFEKGGNYFLLLGEEQKEFVGVDINTGKVRGKHEGSRESVSSNGKYVIDLYSNVVKKFNVL